MLSEFGRTVHENGGGGTDHGHGNVIWVLGGGVRGGRIYGDWPGLGAAQLYQGRDLAVTTDYRTVIAAILERHLRLDDRRLAQIFPDLPPHGPISGRCWRLNRPGWTVATAGGCAPRTGRRVGRRAETRNLRAPPLTEPNCLDGSSEPLFSAAYGSRSRIEG